MSGPKFRFAVVVGFLMVLWWLFNVASAYLWGQQGLDFLLYGKGVLQLGLSVVAGFSVVWLAVWLAGRSQHKKTGFEPVVKDEYGTVFKMGLAQKEGFGMSLSKFLPEIIVVPAWAGLSPVEAELIGFLNGYRNWPVELGQPESLYDRALQRWQTMRDLPGAGPWHRVMALAADLNKIYAYREIRTTPSLKQFWLSDKVRYERRTKEHGGLSAFILSTLPSFRALANADEPTKNARRSLLAALRYMDDPRLLPTNISPLAREFLEYWQRTEAMLESTSPHTEPAAADIAAFQNHLKDSLTECFAGLNVAEGPTDQAEALRLSEQYVLVRPTSLLAGLAQHIPSALRIKLQLWQGAGHQHAIWPFLIAELKKQKLWVESFHDMPQPTGGWVFQQEETQFGPAIMLDLHTAPNLQHIFAETPICTVSLTPSLSKDDIKALLLEHSSQVQTFLQQRF